ncbi:MAG: phosphate ABC transporter substrate-binding protein PstS [Actinomycetota bacterium]
MRRPTMLIVLATVVGMLLAACGSSSPSTTGPGGITQASTLTAAGSTFAAPLYGDWGSLYQASNHVNVSYNAVGSSAGISDILAKTVDFGASDAAYAPSATETSSPTILNIPTAISAVVITYNISALKGTTLNFSPQTLVDIFSAKINNWNNAEIAADNPGVKLPNLAITAVHRSDGSGTTNIFTSYLSAVSATWKATYGASTTINWPTSELGGKGSSGVEADVSQNDGAIGYVELTYAVQNNTPAAGVKNAAGDYVTPTVSSVQNAVSQFDASTIPAGDNITFSLLNEPGATSYPIAGPTYILAYQQQTNGPAGLALVNFLNWGLTVGQAGEASLSYVKLPSAVVTRAQQAVASITYNNTPLASPTS